MNLKNILYGTMAIATFTLVSCSIDESPLAPVPGPKPAEFVVRIHVQPTDALRTVDTWSNWTQAVDVAFVAVLDGAASPDTTTEHGHGGSSMFSGDTPVGVLARSSGATTDTETLLGSLELPEMRINVSIADAESMFEIAHDGDVHEQAADHDQQRISVTLVETVSGHAAHGNATVSHCNIELMAISATDTIAIHFSPVQTAHGLRYEANAELPFATYDMHIEVEAPHFLRDDETVSRWTDHMEIEFHDFDFDSVFASGTIGSDTWVGLGGDSLKVTLRGGPVKTYGAIGMGAMPLSGNETVNFSIRLEDPTVVASGEQLYGSVVTVSVTNTETGVTISETLTPMYGHDGFTFAKNMKLGMGHATGEAPAEDDGHDGH